MAERFCKCRKHHPGFGFRVELDENMNKFANIWPDELATAEPLREDAKETYSQKSKDLLEKRPLPAATSIK